MPNWRRNDVPNCGFSAKLRNGDGATCYTTYRNGSYHELAPSFFEEMTRCRRQKHCRRPPDNPIGPSKLRKYRVYLLLLRPFTSAPSRLLFHGSGSSGSCHAPVPSYFKEMTCCRRQKLHWRWPGNPNSRSKFRNLGLFTFTRSQLILRRRLRGWLAAFGDRSNST